MNQRCAESSPYVLKQYKQSFKLFLVNILMNKDLLLGLCLEVDFVLD